MDLLASYSKRPELLHDLAATWRQLGNAQAGEGSGRTSVCSVPRSAKLPQPLQERLSDGDQRAILERYESGMLRQQLAREYGISVSSVGRLLRAERLRRNNTAEDKRLQSFRSFQ